MTIATAPATVGTKVAAVPTRRMEFRLPVAVAGVNLINERRGYRGINVHMGWTFTTVSI